MDKTIGFLKKKQIALPVQEGSESL